MVQQADLKVRLDDALQTAQATGVIPLVNGKPLVSRAEILKTFPGPTGELMARKFDLAQQEGQDRLSMAGTSVAEDQAKLATLLPKPGEVFTPEQEDRVQAYQNALSVKLKALRDDPAGYVVGQGGQVAKAWDQLGQLQQDAKADPVAVSAATKRAVAVTVQAQTDMGVPAYAAKPMPKSVAESYAGDLRTAGPDQLPVIAQQIVSMGPQAVSQVVAAGAPPGFAAMAAVQDPIWNRQLANAMAMKDEDKGTVLQARNIKAKDLDQKITTAMSAFSGTLQAGAVPLYQNAVRDVAIMNIGRGMGINDAVDAAAKPFTAGYNIAGMLRVPASHDLDAVKAGLAKTIRDIESGNAPFDIVPPPSGIPGTTPADDLAALQEGLRNGSYVWLTNESGDGAILTLPNGRYVQSGNSGRVEVPFDVAERLGRQNPIPMRPAPGNPRGFGSAK
jgi:hypothetical protein